MPQSKIYDSNTVFLRMNKLRILGVQYQTQLKAV